MNHLDGFSGYGGFSLAFEQAGWKFDKTYFSEIDKYAIANYKYNFPNATYAGSITDIPTNGIINKLDLFTFGWPCQDNSIAGKRKGQSRGTRSGLLYSAVNVIDKYKPRCFVAENVAGLYSVNKGIDIIESLKVLSFLNDSCPQYDIEMQLLNTLWFLPQNRERLFFVGHLRDGSRKEIFPITENDSRPIERPAEATSVRCLTAGGHSGGMHSGMILICDSGKGRKLEERENVAPLRSNTGAGHGNYIIDINTLGGKSKTRRGGIFLGQTPVLDVKSNIGVIITDDRFKSRPNRGKHDLAPTLTHTCPNLKVNNVRRLTPVECERLQGLPDEHTRFGIFEKQVWTNKKEKAFKIIEGVVKLSDTQRYKLCGNGVSIPPVKMIAEKLKQAYNL